METKPKSRRGRPTGIPREGKYGTGVPTKVVRVPSEIAANIADILATFEQIKLTVDAWEMKIEDVAAESKHHKPSPRYEQALKLLKELREYLD